MDNGTGCDTTPNVRDFTAGESRANRLREIAADLRAMARSPFPRQISLCGIADELSEAAAALDRQAEHRGMDWAAVRLAQNRAEHGTWEEFKGHAPWQRCGCDLAEQIRSRV